MSPLNRCRGCRLPIARNRVSCTFCWARVPEALRTAVGKAIGDGARTLAELEVSHWLRQNKSKQQQA